VSNVLFVCIQNAGRSQRPQALFERAADGAHAARSAGSRPADKVHPVVVDAMFGGPVTGASMNPARSLGPALVAGDLTSLWVYLLAPATGACVAAVTYQFLRSEETA
jgi:glycerol uptake facilitator-like aquaporin